MAIVYQNNLTNDKYYKLSKVFNYVCEKAGTYCDNCPFYYEKENYNILDCKDYFIDYPLEALAAANFSSFEESPPALHELLKIPINKKWRFHNFIYRITKINEDEILERYDFDTERFIPEINYENIYKLLNNIKDIKPITNWLDSDRASAEHIKELFPSATKIKREKDHLYCYLDTNDTKIEINAALFPHLENGKEINIDFILTLEDTNEN